MSLKNLLNRKKEETTRVTVTLADSTKEAVDQVAEDLGLSRSATMNYLLSKELVIEAVIEEGGQLYVQLPGRELQALTPAPHGWNLIPLPSQTMPKERESNNGIQTVLEAPD